MRKVIERQYKIGEVDIADIEINLASRDEIPQVLIGLQALYRDRNTLKEVLRVLEETIPSGIDRKNGRPGMQLWNILVLGVIRLICNIDYDKLTELANEHQTIRRFLGHTIYDGCKRYKLQTVKDNVRLLSPEIIDRISQCVVRLGHRGFTSGHVLRGRCDSFPVETNAHYPTDINLLWDAIRKMIVLIARGCADMKISQWRQSARILKNIKELYNKIIRMKHSNSKNEAKKHEKQQRIKAAHVQYVDYVESCVGRVRRTAAGLKEMGYGKVAVIMLIDKFIMDAERQIDQIRRRVVGGEIIPHHEKVFSLFEPHTEWISKGKAGVPQELGLKVCILEDQHGYILHHQVMEHQTDDKVAIPMICETRCKFPALKACSFDKGFHSPDNQARLAEILDHVILPRKGRLSSEAQKIESSPEFVKSRRKHSAVESAINALENHSLDRCPDHGIEGFKRYVAIAVLARNLQILGATIRKKALKRLQRCQKPVMLAA